MSVRSNLRRAAAWAALVLGILCTTAVPAQPAAAGPESRPPTPRPFPPAELFFGQADFIQARLSPSGKWLAVKTSAGGARNGLILIDVAAGRPATSIVRFDNVDVDDFYWVNDDYLVLDVIDLRAGGGRQRDAAGLWRVKRDGSDLEQLILTQAGGTDNSVTGSRIVSRKLDGTHRLLFVPATVGDEVIVGQDQWQLDQWVGIRPMALNIFSGRTRTIAEGLPGHVRSWIFGPDGTPRLAVARKDGRVTVLWRAAEGWKVLLDSPQFEEAWVPRTIDAEGRLYVLVNAGEVGESRLHRFDFATGQPEREPLVSTPGFDFRGRLISESGGTRVLGMRLETDAGQTIWFDKRLSAIQEEADKRFAGLINDLSCRRCGEPDMTVLVYSYAAQHPGMYSVYTAADKRWRSLINRRPKIEPTRMATMDFERIQARDGRSIPVWVTRPSELVAARAKPLPAVLLVHGGPWVRGAFWEWDAEAQFLASRGYVVIQPEFRGSTGYGAEHFRAGWKQWGQAMQDDVADATLWAVKQGIVDGNRVCIAGGSYGGYSTLMGLIRHPELYRCGIAWAAVTEPALLFRWTSSSDISDEARRFGYPRLLGDPKTDAAMLEANSPLRRAAEIRRPLLLAMGGEDARVPLEHGERLRDAMRRAGQPLEWVVYKDEAHGWLKTENQVDFYGRMERFLAQHLK